MVLVLGDELNQQEWYSNLVEKEILGRGTSIPKAQAWMKRKGRASANWLYAVTVFLAVWHGPTQSEPFWPSWPSHVPTPLDQIQLDGHMLYWAAQEMHNLYRHCTSGQHHHLCLLY